MNALKTKIRNRLEEDHLDLRMRIERHVGTSILEGWGVATPRFWAGGSWGGRRGSWNIVISFEHTGSMFKSGDFCREI